MTSMEPLSDLSGIPIFDQQCAHRNEGLSPSLISFTIDQTAGDFAHARQISNNSGTRYSIIG
jgi:hypothetical protein